MISHSLQNRMLCVRCAHSAARSNAAVAAQMIQHRLASSSSSSSSSATRQPTQAPTARRTTPPASSPRSGGNLTPSAAAASATAAAAAAAARVRINAEKEAPPKETAEAYKARYKSAARRWTSTIIALPILLVTSYYLFDRLALGHAPKVMNREVTKRDD
ncbi:hypothetical protein IF1G_04222 [Cordyceps javanica]|uniref:Uncharacterized protein n=1 Tax=Cordyceps javanica TaxID=43265 RepID=A0A545V5J7_9HYPO|nr:hypothetical protein IF1G_04222 [Cordyceps javanica]TQW08240.1 mucin-like glycoprotein domain-containing protein [Cordyceps javanica]